MISVRLWYCGKKKVETSLSNRIKVIVKFYLVCNIESCCKFQVMKINLWKVFVISSESCELQVDHFVEEFVCVCESQVVHFVEEFVCIQMLVVSFWRPFSFESKDCIFISYHNTTYLWELNWGVNDIVNWIELTDWRFVFAYLSYLSTKTHCYNHLSVRTQFGYL